MVKKCYFLLLLFCYLVSMSLSVWTMTTNSHWPPQPPPPISSYFVSCFSIQFPPGQTLHCVCWLLWNLFKKDNRTNLPFFSMVKMLNENGQNYLMNFFHLFSHDSSRFFICSVCCCSAEKTTTTTTMNWSGYHCKWRVKLFIFSLCKWKSLNWIDFFFVLK